MKPDAALSLLSLATRAGKIKSGEFAVEKAIKNGTAKLVIVASDASEATKKSYRDLCRFYKTDYIEYVDKTTLGQTIGKEFRAAVAVCDGHFAKSIVERAQDRPHTHDGGR